MRLRSIGWNKFIFIKFFRDVKNFLEIFNKKGIKGAEAQSDRGIKARGKGDFKKVDLRY